MINLPTSEANKLANRIDNLHNILMIDLTNAQLERYSRHILLPEIDEEGQNKLFNAHIVCVGLGGLAAVALPILAGAGIGTLSLIDADRVELSNLPRQTLYPEAMVQSPKTLAAMEGLSALNSEIKLQMANARLTAENAETLLANADIILDASDNFPTRYAINDAACQLAIPFISASLLRFSGQISSFFPHIQDALGPSPCYRCLYHEAPPDNLLPRCEQLGIFSPTASLVGAIQASEALKYLLNIGNLLHRKLLMIELDELRFHTINYAYREDCLCRKR